VQYTLVYELGRFAHHVECSHTMTEKVNNQLLRLAKGIYTCEGSIIVGTLNMQVMVMVTMNKVKVASGPFHFSFRSGLKIPYMTIIPRV